MKKLMSFAVIALLCAACNNNSSEVKQEEAPERNGWAGPDLYGNVKSVTVNVFGLKQKFDEEIYGDKVSHKVFYFDSSTGNVTEAIYYGADEINSRTTYSYDSNGNLIEKCMRSPDGSLDSKYTYSYDSNGNLIEENTYDFRSKNKETKFVYVYDHKGNVREQNSYDASDGDLYGKLIVDYDSTGVQKEWAYYVVVDNVAYFDQGSKNLKQGVVFVIEDNLVKYPYADNGLESVNQCDSTGMVYSSGRLIKKQIYTYDSSDQKTEHFENRNNYYEGLYDYCSIKKCSYLYDSDGNLIERTLIDGGSFLDDNATYVYDSKGNMIEESLYQIDGSLHTKRICIYDVNGRKTEETLYDGDDGQPICKYIYEYDSKGNVIEVKDYRSTNWLSNVTQYEIEYYQ